MDLFHTTKNVYNVGDVVRVADFTGDCCNYHASSVDRWVNDFLDDIKPDQEPLRRVCIYAFSSLAHCASYIGRREDADEYNFYKVEINAQNPHPMSLTDTIIEASSSTLQNRLRVEYWHPTRRWSFNEFLGTEMIILEEIEIVPPGFFLMQDDYSDDKRIANRM